jgi:hypothetical protein
MTCSIGLFPKHARKRSQLELGTDLIVFFSFISFCKNMPIYYNLRSGMLALHVSLGCLLTNIIQAIY